MARTARRSRGHPMNTAAPSRALTLKATLAGLTSANGIQGGLIVTPDGFVILSSLPAGYAVEAIAALGATVGRELELGAERLERGPFTAAHFASRDGALFVGASTVGFLILIGHHHADVAAVLTGLREAEAALR